MSTLPPPLQDSVGAVCTGAAFIKAAMAIAMHGSDLEFLPCTSDLLALISDQELQAALVL